MTDKAGPFFDPWGDDYHERLDRCLRSLGGRDSRYYNELKARWILRLTEKYVGETRGKDFLDLGCGTGLTEELLGPHFHWGTGLDISASMLKAGRCRQRNCSFVVGTVRRLPFASHSFDLVVSITLFHHLEEGELMGLMKEVRRVLRPGGLTIHFDHNPYNFLTRQVVAKCEFDANTTLRSRRQIVRLLRSHGYQLRESGYLAFIPAAVAFLEPLEKWLKSVPLGGQYFLAATA